MEIVLPTCCASSAFYPSLMRWKRSMSVEFYIMCHHALETQHVGRILYHALEAQHVGRIMLITPHAIFQANQKVDYH